MDKKLGNSSEKKTDREINPEINPEISDSPTNILEGDSGLKYKLTRIIGRGTFGLVYQAELLDYPEKMFAIKRYFRNLHPNISLLEACILNYLKKRTEKLPYNNILCMYDGKITHYDIFIITKYFENQPFHEFFRTLSVIDVKHYMFQLIYSLRCIHELGIIHRDIKPNNFLYDPETKESLLIDFGLAEADIGNTEWHKKNEDKTDGDYLAIMKIQKGSSRHKTGTKGFLAPEVIFKAPYQTTAVDIWSAGVNFLCFLASRMPIFNLNKFNTITEDVVRDIEPLIIIFGAESIEKIGKEFHHSILIGDDIKKLICKDGLRSLFVRKDFGEDAFDLCRQMLTVNPKERITAKDALKHKFFDEIRDSVQYKGKINY